MIHQLIEDITVNLHHIMDFDTGHQGRSFKIHIMNTGETVHNMSEFVLSASAALEGGSGV